MSFITQEELHRAMGPVVQRYGPQVAGAACHMAVIINLLDKSEMPEHMKDIALMNQSMMTFAYLKGMGAESSSANFIECLNEVQRVNIALSSAAAANMPVDDSHVGVSASDPQQALAALQSGQCSLLERIGNAFRRVPLVVDER